MSYALILAGIILTVAGVRNTHGALYQLLLNDFTGTNSFVWWVLSIVVIGAIGYLPDFRKLANYFLALILLVLLLAQNKSGHDFFTNFTAALKQPIPPAPKAGTSTGTGTGIVGAVTNAVTNNPMINPLGALQNIGKAFGF